MAYVVCSDYEESFFSFRGPSIHGYRLDNQRGYGDGSRDAYGCHKKEGCIKILDTSLDMVFGQILTKRGGGV